MDGWNGTWNKNYGSDVSLWSWHAPKVTSRVNGARRCIARMAGGLEKELRHSEAAESMRAGAGSGGRQCMLLGEIAGYKLFQ